MRSTGRAAVLVLVVLMVFSLTGCMFSSVEELYSLPRMSQRYVQLQELVDQRIRDGGEYAAPLSGDHRQSIQLQDLNGDGVEEAIAFLATADHDPDICIFCPDGEENYYLYAVIQGEGYAVSRVEYADLNGDGGAEFIIVWQVGGDIRLLTAYTLGGDVPVEELLSVDCGRILVEDIDGDGGDELLDIRRDSAGGGVLRMYDGSDNALFQSQAPLSVGVDEVVRARMGYLADMTPALFVESECDNGMLITDVFTVGGGALENITVTAGGQSGTLREKPGYAMDINGDRIMEIPESSGGLVDWYALDGAGRKQLAMTTWHNHDDGWYLTMADELLSGLEVEMRATHPGESAAVFSQREKGELFAIYTLTGENRTERAEEGRFLLRETDTAVYAAEIFDPDIDEEAILASFELIYSEWQTGDL